MLRGIDDRRPRYVWTRGGKRELGVGKVGKQAEVRERGKARRGIAEQIGDGKTVGGPAGHELPKRAILQKQKCSCRLIFY